MIKLKAQYIGLITGGLMIAALLFSFYVLKLPTTSKFQYVVYCIFSAGVIWSLLSHYKSDPGDKKFKDYFAQGFKTFIVVVLLMVIYTFIFVKLNPQIIESFIEENNKALAAEGNRTQAEILDNAAKIKSLFLLTMLMGATITYLVIGALIAAIGSGFFSQKK